MKVLVCIFLLVSIKSYTQSKIIITRSPSSTIYVGIINYAYIKSENNSKKYLLKGENLSVLKQNSDTFRVFANKHGQGDLLLYEIIKEDTLLIERKRINIEKIPDGEISIGRKLLKNGIPKRIFLNSKTIDIFFNVDFFGADKWMTITSYEIIVQNRKIICSSNFIPEVVKELVRKNIGNINITINKIMVKRPDKVIVPFGEISFNVY